MKFTEIARNLLNEGRAYKWGQGRLLEFHGIRNPADWQYCALGIKAREFGVPNVVLAYFDAAPNLNYTDFDGLENVFGCNDAAATREDVAARLSWRGGEADIESWVAYLKMLLPEAVAWAQKNGYKSLLEDLPEGT